MEFTPLPNDIINEEVFPDHCKCCDYWLKAPSVKATFALFANMKTVITLFPRSNGCDFFGQINPAAHDPLFLQLVAKNNPKLFVFPKVYQLKQPYPARG